MTDWHVRDLCKRRGIRPPSWLMADLLASAADLAEIKIRGVTVPWPDERSPGGPLRSTSEVRQGGRPCPFEWCTSAMYIREIPVGEALSRMTDHEGAGW